MKILLFLRSQKLVSRLQTISNDINMKLNLIFNDDQPARIENILLGTVLALFPLLYLTLRGWTNTLTIILFGLALVHFFRLPRSEWQIKNISGTEWAVIAALASGFLAILISQLLRPRRGCQVLWRAVANVIVSAGFLLLLKKKIDFVQVFQYICPLSLLILVASVHLSPVPIDTWGGGRFGTYFVDPNTIGINTMLLAFLCLFSIDAISKDGLALRLLKYAGVLAGFYLE